MQSKIQFMSVLHYKIIGKYTFCEATPAALTVFVFNGREGMEEQSQEIKGGDGAVNWISN